MPMPDKIAMIVGKMSGEKLKDERTEESGDNYQMAMDAACEDILLAIESKDAKLFCSAMKDFHSAFDEQMESMEYEEGEK